MKCKIPKFSSRDARSSKKKRKKRGMAEQGKESFPLRIQFPGRQLSGTSFSAPSLCVLMPMFLTVCIRVYMWMHFRLPSASDIVDLQSITCPSLLSIIIFDATSAFLYIVSIHFLPQPLSCQWSTAGRVTHHHLKCEQKILFFPELESLFLSFLCSIRGIVSFPIRQNCHHRDSRGSVARKKGTSS